MDPPVDPPMPHLPPKVIYSQEHIQQGIKSKLDILVVVDNSLSMYEEQQNLLSAWINLQTNSKMWIGKLGSQQRMFPITNTVLG